jgi:hypothetical protein
MILRNFIASAATALVVVTASACRHGESLETSKMPEALRADYDLFAHKCSKCHSLARPLSANITDDEQWVLYVNRMRRQPASGISYTDQEAILRFLRYYAADLRRIQAEKNGGTPAPSHSTQSVPVLSPSAAPPAPAATVDGGGT